MRLYDSLFVKEKISTGVSEGDQLRVTNLNVGYRNCRWPELSARAHIRQPAHHEPVNGLGDGDTAPDWEVTGPLTLRLRAERGHQPQGRIYTITIECVDAAGNTSQRAVTVSVPRS